MVLLTHGYFLHDDPKEQAIMRPYPPLGLLSIAAWLDAKGIDNLVWDATFSTAELQRQFILDTKPSFLAIYTNLMTKVNVVKLMQWVKSQPALQHTQIALGGPDITYNATEYLSRGGDVAVLGEGEQSLAEIVMAPQDREIWANVPGLAFLLPDGTLFKTAAREKIRNLDDLPFPARHKIDLNLYLNTWKTRHGQSAISISTQRGCPYTCKWCSTAVYGQSYRRRSAKSVVNEIVYLQKQYDFDLIWFVDDVFTVSHKWLGELVTELETRKVNIRYECITRADRLQEEVLHALKNSGCFRVWIGAESGSQRIIDAMDRRVEVSQVRKMIRYASEIGIETGTFIMLGYPGETEADIRETLYHLKVANPDLFTITVAYPIKGTSLYQEVESNIVAGNQWETHTDRDLDFPRTYSRKYYNYAVRWTVNSVHLHKLRLKNRHVSFSGLQLALKIAVSKLGMMLTK